MSWNKAIGSLGRDMRSLTHGVGKVSDFAQEKMQRVSALYQHRADIGVDTNSVRRIRQSQNPFSSVDRQGYRSIHGNRTNRDLDSRKHLHHQDTCYRLFMTNPMARRIINIMVDFIIGSGIYPEIDKESSPEAQDLYDVIMAHWNDFHNNWPIKQEFKCRELLLYGEQCWRPFVNEHTGHVKLGYIDPSRIGGVHMNEENPEEPGSLYIRNIHQTKYEIFTEDPNQLLMGDVFFMKENSVSNANRGYSELLYAIDWLYSLDEALFDILDNLAFSNLFIWDIKCTGLQGDALIARRKEIEENRPRAGGFYVHNEDEEWQARSPGITTTANLEALKLIKTFILGGAGQPEHWHGSGGDVNRAVGSVMAVPTFRSMERKQRHFSHNIQMDLRYQCEQAAASGRYNAKSSANMIEQGRKGIELHKPKIEEEKYDVVSETLKTVTDALATAKDSPWITEETSQRVFIDILNRFDVGIDVTKELEELKKSKSHLEGELDDKLKEFRKGVFMSDAELKKFAMKEYDRATLSGTKESRLGN